MRWRRIGRRSDECGLARMSVPTPNASVRRGVRKSLFFETLRRPSTLRRMGCLALRRCIALFPSSPRRIPPIRDNPPHPPDPRSILSDPSVKIRHPFCHRKDVKIDVKSQTFAQQRERKTRPRQYQTNRRPRKTRDFCTARGPVPRNASKSRPPQHSESLPAQRLPAAGTASFALLRDLRACNSQCRKWRRPVKIIGNPC